MRIPRYERQVAFKDASHGPMPIDAFGADVAKARADQATALQGATDLLTQHIINWQKAETHRQVLAADNGFRTDLQDALYNTEVNENNTPKGLLLRKGELAKGTTQAFDETVVELKKKHSKNLTAGAQRMFNEIADQSALTGRNGVISHEAGQIREAYNASVESNIRLRVDDLVKLPADQAFVAMEDTVKLAGVSSKQAGNPDAVTTEIMQKTAGEATIHYLSTHAEKDYLGSKAFFEKVKGKLPAQYLEAATKVLDGAETLHLQNVAWTSFQKTGRLADGLLDHSQIDSFVRQNFPDATPEKQRAVATYVGAKASEADHNTKVFRASQDYKIIEGISDIKENGGTLDQALKFIGESNPRDATTSLQYKDIAKQLWATSGQSENLEVWSQLYFGVQAKTVGKDDLFAAYQVGDINAGSLKGLLRDMMDNEIKGIDTAKRVTWDRIKENAEKRGLKDLELAKYLYQVNIMANGKTLEEATNIANDELKKVEAPGHLFKQKAYKVDLERDDPEREKIGRLDTLLRSRTTVLDIGEIVAREKGTDSVRADDIALWLQTNFASENADGIPGQYIHNAVVSLKARHRKITADAIKFAIETSPNKDGRH